MLTMYAKNEQANLSAAPSREFFVDAAMIKPLRKTTKLSQAKFAALLRIEVSTVRNGNKAEGNRPDLPRR
jgi:DNA-binding transcriptional regulator YiaG